MNPNIVLKTTTDKLKNALAAIVGRAIRSIKRFTTALHNKCNLVVYVDRVGRVCCQFLKKDAFSGYHFEFGSTICTVTNKETGDVYLVEFGNLNKCSCPAYKYNHAKQPCKHMKMVKDVCGGIFPHKIRAELRGDLKQAIAATQKECTHPKAIIGLDAHYCPDCKKSIEYGTSTYEEILNRDSKPEKKSKKAIIIDPQDVPTGVHLKRTDDWMCVEYDVNVRRVTNQRQSSGEFWRHPVLQNIGRIVEHPQGIYTYRIRSGVGRVFESVQQAIAYLVQVVGTSFDEIADAHWEFNSF